MKIQIKKIYKITVIIILFFIALNFVPVKFALNLKNNTYQTNGYICTYTTATDGNWYASANDNPFLEKDIYINVYDTDDFSALKEIMDSRSGVPILNKYVFYGEIEQKEIDDGILFNYMESPKWDIVYPIKRQSLMAIIMPESYLNVYDFNWINVIKDLFV